MSLCSLQNSSQAPGLHSEIVSVSHCTVKTLVLLVALHSPTLRTTFCFPDILLCTALNFSDSVIVLIKEGVKPQVNLCFKTALVALNGLSKEARLKWRWSFCDTFTYHVPAEDNTSLGSSNGVSCSRVPKHMSRQVPAYKTGQLGDDWSENRFTGTNTRGLVLSVTRGSFAVSDHTGLVSFHQDLSFSVFCFSFLQKPILLTFSTTPKANNCKNCDVEMMRGAFIC